jgi:hypothetical protein
MKSCSCNVLITCGPKHKEYTNAYNFLAQYDPKHRNNRSNASYLHGQTNSSKA